MDKEVKYIAEKYPDQFERKMNEILETGEWRVAETEMSVTDHHYHAILIRSERPRLSRADALRALPVVESYAPEKDGMKHNMIQDLIKHY